MSLESVKQAYQEWEVFESEPTRLLKDEIRQVMENPTDESDEFFKSVFDNFDESNTDGFWIQQSITYGLYMKENKLDYVSYLENVVSDEKKYWVIGTSISSAARSLGVIAPYPNQVLADAIETERYDPAYEWGGDGHLDKIASDSLRAAAYGGYIMTATDFQTGFDAGQAMKASGKQPTVAMAEEFIARWRKEHGRE